MEYAQWWIQANQAGPELYLRQLGAGSDDIIANARTAMGHRHFPNLITGLTSTRGFYSDSISR